MHPESMAPATILQSPDTDADALRKALADLVQRTEELADANQRMESFCYSVSHDLRTPLRAINGFAHILVRRHQDRLDAEGLHYLNNIVQASSHMSRLIEDLLNYSRLGRKTLNIETLALQEVFGGIIAHFQEQMSELGATVNLATDLPVVRGDATLLTQIFCNLLDNALKYHQPGQAPVIAVDWQEQDGYSLVCVRDNGIGIAPEHHESIFGIFQRLHSQDAYPGTGIGLATVKEAVDLLGGTVRVDSAPGKGSMFQVQLKLADSAR